MVCTCQMFQTHGICYHTGYDPSKNLSEQLQGMDAEEVRPKQIQAARIRPRAVERMFDFLDLMEQEKPGSSGLSGDWHSK